MRCRQCKKKTGLISFSCKCGHEFCSEHRFPDTHSCTFDHKVEDIKRLAMDNRRVVTLKVGSI